MINYFANAAAPSSEHTVKLRLFYFDGHHFMLRSDDMLNTDDDGK